MMHTEVKEQGMDQTSFATDRFVQIFPFQIWHQQMMCLAYFSD